MKISKIIIDMGNNELKEFEPIDAIILAICKGEKEQENVILEQLGNNPSLHLKMLKDIIHYQESQPEQENKNEQVKDEDELPIEIIDEK